MASCVSKQKFQRKIMLEREPLLDALRELRKRILDWDRQKGKN